VIEHPAARLDVGERQIRVFLRFDGGALEPLEQRRRGLRIVERHAQRNGVGEQADGFFDARNRRGTAGDDYAEQHVVMSAIDVPWLMPRQQQRPQRLHERAERDLRVARALFERRGLGAIERVVGARRTVVAIARSGHRRRNRAGGLEAVQHLRPELFAGGVVAVAEPLDVLAERRRRRQRERLSVHARVVVTEHVRHQQRDAPAVEDDVMERPDHFEIAFAVNEDRHAHRQLVGEIESALAVGCAIGIDVAMLDLNLERRVFQDDLQRARCFLVHEHRAQHIVAAEHVVPCRFEQRHIERARQAIRDLFDVGLRSRLQEVVEEHALLHRRQRIQILEVLAGDHWKMSSSSSTLSPAYERSAGVNSTGRCRQCSIAMRSSRCHAARSVSIVGERKRCRSYASVNCNAPSMTIPLTSSSASVSASGLTWPSSGSLTKRNVECVGVPSVPR
jgi:hypothetical protein